MWLAYAKIPTDRGFSARARRRLDGLCEPAGTADGPRAHAEPTILLELFGNVLDTVVERQYVTPVDDRKS